MMKPTYRLAACLLTVSLLSGILAGCGSGGTASNSVSSSAPPALKRAAGKPQNRLPFPLIRKQLLIPLAKCAAATIPICLPVAPMKTMPIPVT